MRKTAMVLVAFILALALPGVGLAKTKILWWSHCANEPGKVKVIESIKSD